MPTNVDEAVVVAFHQVLGYFEIEVDLYYQDVSVANIIINLPKSGVHTDADWRSQWVAAVNAFCVANNATLPSTFWIALDGEPGARVFTSYEALVSQSGTSAPSATVANNGFTGVTFTWARTSAGVYTLTASSAVFTSGKTGIFFQPLANLNAGIKATVTSTTVITVTAAVQSVAVLGLLGLTTTPTDALLSGTLMEVRVYP